VDPFFPAFQWHFCVFDFPVFQVVVYVHSKGSYHPHEFQDQWRDYVTAGALSQECRLMPEYCNMCSSRMSPVPYPHSPGNMWAARCGYISELMDPKAGSYPRLPHSTVELPHHFGWLSSILFWCAISSNLLINFVNFKFSGSNAKRCVLFVHCACDLWPSFILVTSGFWDCHKQLSEGSGSCWSAMPHNRCLGLQKMLVMKKGFTHWLVNHKYMFPIVFIIVSVGMGDPEVAGDLFSLSLFIYIYSIYIYIYLLFICLFLVP
jgi:hypothetical protein